MVQETNTSFLRSWAIRSALGCSLSLGIVLLVGCLMAGLAAVPERLLDRDLKALVFAVGFIGIMLVGMVAALGFAFVSRQRAHAQLDAAFAALGLTGRGYLLSGRQYHGVYQGREAHAYYHVSGGRYLRTPDIQLYLNGNFRTRVHVMADKTLARVGAALAAPLGLKAQPLDLPSYTGYRLYAADADWGRQLFNDLEVQAAVARLVRPEAPGMRTLVIGPAAIYVQMRYFTLDIFSPELAHQWATDLNLIARAAERLAPPAQTVQESSWERAAREDRSRYTWIAVGVVGALVVCPVLFIGAFFGVMALLGRFP